MMNEVMYPTSVVVLASQISNYTSDAICSNIYKG